MKRILCPKCDNYITFDETKYTEGQSLVFICEHCKKQFSIRIGKTKLKATRKEEVLDEQANSRDCGSIVVVENVFGYKQVHPLKEGDNVVGRRNKGTEVDVSIERPTRVWTVSIVSSMFPVTRRESWCIPCGTTRALPEHF